MLKRYAAGLLTLAAAPLAAADCGRISAENSAIDQLCPYSQGLARVQIRGAWGFVDPAGRLAIEPRSDIVQVMDFSEGLAEVQIGERLGYLDREGTVRIEPRFQETDSFSEGLAFAREAEDGPAGYIDASGAWAIAPRFLKGGRFTGGVAVVAEQYGQSYLIDRKGEVVKRFDHPIDIDAEPRHGVYRATLPAVRELVHLDGRRRPLPAGAERMSYSNGLLILPATDAEGAPVGAMAPDGTWVIEPAFAELAAFSEGVAIAAPAASPALKGLIDGKGRWLVPARYARLERLEGGFYEAQADGAVSRIDILDARGRPLFQADCARLDQRAAGAWTVFSGCGASWAVHAGDAVRIHRVAIDEPEIESSGPYLLLTQPERSDAEKEELDENERYARTFVLLHADGVLLDSASPQIKGHWDWARLVTPRGPRAEAAPGLLPVAVLIRGYEQVGILTRRHAIVSRPEWQYDLNALGFDDGKALDGPLPVKTEAGWGAIDGNGDWVIRPRYREMSLFRHGLAFALDVRVDAARRDALREQVTEDVPEALLDQLSSETHELVLDQSGAEHEFPDGRGFSRVEPWTLQGRDEEERPIRHDVRTGTTRPLVAEEGVERDDDAFGGLAPARKDGRWGLLDAAGRWVRPPVYEEQPDEVLDGERFLGWTVKNGAGLGWVTPEGRELIAPRYQELAFDADDGLFRVKLDGRYGVLDAEGRTRLEPVYAGISLIGGGWALADGGERRGLLDARGEWVVKPGAYALDQLDERPYAAESVKGEAYLLRVDGVISTRERPQPFAGDKPEYWLSRFERRDGDETTVLHGFDWRTRLTLPGEVYGRFHDGRIVFKKWRRGEYYAAFANADGRIYGPFRYPELEDFADGRARFKQVLTVKARRGQPAEELERYGYLDREGKVAIPARYENGDAFSEKRAVVALKGNLGIIDDAGRLLLHGAWRCGTDPVLLDGRGKVIWPKDESGSCK